MSIRARTMLAFTFIILFSMIICTPILIGAQGQSPANMTNPHKMGVKITSPAGNATIVSGPLTINGYSSDTSQTNCKVYVDWNDLKPMQNVTAKGPGGGNDYSNWTYTYTDKYHIIAPGINELTSKITCFDNPNNITNKYYSINITGLKNNTVSPTLPTGSNVTSEIHNLDYLPQYDGLYHNVFQPIVQHESTSEDTSNNDDEDNNDDVKDDDKNDDSNGDDDNTKNDDDSSESNNNSDEEKKDGVNSSGEGNDDDDSSIRDGGTHHSQDDGKREHQDKHEKKDNHNNKDKAGEKNKGAHSKNVKIHKS
jgi:hypothetical protein